MNKIVMVRNVGDFRKERNDEHKTLAIQLQGKWLSQNGFTERQQVRITIMEPGRIQIESLTYNEMGGNND